MKKLTGIVLIVLAAGCHRRQTGDAAAAACVPVTTAAVEGSHIANLMGTHAVSFVVTSGARAGQTVTGQLALRPQADSLRRGPWSPAEQRAIGHLDVAPEDLGAIRMGDAVSSDPLQPGVAVYVSAAAGASITVTARVGAFSNSRGEPAYDAGYFALYIRQVDSTGIRGGWASGDGRAEVASGHFCALKVPV